MSDEAVMAPVVEVPAPAPVVEPPAPPPPPPVEPKPEEDSATTVMKICAEYQPRLFAIKQGLFNPGALVNNSWAYYSALTEDDKTFLASHVVNAFRELEKKLLDEMNARVATAIGR